MHTTKQVGQVGGAILSALWTTVSLTLDTQGVLPPGVSLSYYALGGFVAFIGCMAWIFWDKQSQINSMRGGVRLEARPIKMGASPVKIRRSGGVQVIPIEVTAQGGTEITLDLEIWTSRDIHTDNIVLNIVSSRIAFLSVPWWKVWKAWPMMLRDLPVFKTTVGIRPEGGRYRKFIRYADAQPFKDTVTFKLQSKDVVEALSWSHSFMMELVLVTGAPDYKYRKRLEWKALEKETSEPV